MMKKLKKLMVGCLMVVMCLGNTFMVNAEERGVLPSGEIIEIKEIVQEVKSRIMGITFSSYEVIPIE